MVFSQSKNNYTASDRCKYSTQSNYIWLKFWLFISLPFFSQGAITNGSNMFKRCLHVDIFQFLGAMIYELLADFITSQNSHLASRMSAIHHPVFFQLPYTDSDSVSHKKLERGDGNRFYLRSESGVHFVHQE